MIQFEKVNFTYTANPEEMSLRNISLAIKDGECVLLTGPSGCGKSTLLRLLNGLIPEFYDGDMTGKIFIDGTDISEKGIYDFVGKIGTVFQNPRSQFFNVDTTSELAFGCENMAIPEAEILSRMEGTVSAFRIEKLMDRNIFELSGGEKQKIACASIHVLGPDIILLDEPSANLDYEAAENLRQIIQCWKEEGKTILIAEHRINYVWDLADRVVIFEAGRVVHDFEKKEISSFTDEQCRGYKLRSLKRISPQEIAFEKRNRAENRKKNINAEGREGNDFRKEDIRLEGFTYAYKSGENVLNIRKMQIKRAKATAIVGANGAGKTTFLECLCGIRKNKGKMWLDGKEYDSKARLKVIFMVMQDPNHQLFTESVLDEVLISMPEENEERAKQILSQVDLSDFADRHPMSLSGGQKQRVALACAIASECPILLLDEPTSGLDLTHMLEVAEILNQLKKQGRTIITVTHDSEFIEKCCDEVIVYGK
ncbi:MAG: ABC transporter ATP-binding protein [Lachnospiraceae bacterium]|nr:ABC transporter ATP-binding protein [Lachnospiraceae bacterium]